MTAANSGKSFGEYFGIEHHRGIWEGIMHVSKCINGGLAAEAQHQQQETSSRQSRMNDVYKQTWIRIGYDESRTRVLVPNMVLIPSLGSGPKHFYIVGFMEEFFITLTNSLELKAEIANERLPGKCVVELEDICISNELYAEKTLSSELRATGLEVKFTRIDYEAVLADSECRFPGMNPWVYSEAWSHKHIADRDNLFVCVIDKVLGAREVEIHDHKNLLTSKKNVMLAIALTRIPIKKDKRNPDSFRVCGKPRRFVFDYEAYGLNVQDAGLFNSEIEILPGLGILSDIPSYENKEIIRIFKSMGNLLGTSKELAFDGTLFDGLSCLTEADIRKIETMECVFAQGYANDGSLESLLRMKAGIENNPSRICLFLLINIFFFKFPLFNATFVKLLSDLGLMSKKALSPEDLKAGFRRPNGILAKAPFRGLVLEFFSTLGDFVIKQSKVARTPISGAEMASKLQFGPAEYFQKKNIQEEITNFMACLLSDHKAIF